MRTAAGALAVALTAPLAAPSSARAALPETACISAAPAPATDPALDERFLAAARAAETVLDQGAPPGSRINAAALTVSAPEGAQPSSAARGAYCSVAGELARRGLYGNPLDAAGYLVVAFLSAEQAGRPEESARAAYRLGLSLTINPIGAPAGRGSLKRGADPVVDLTRSLLDTRRGARACEALNRLPTNGDASQANATLAFACSSQRAGERQDALLSGLADLRLARMWLDAAARYPEQAEQLDVMAADLAEDRLTASAGALRPEITERLIETVLDAGRADEAAGRAIDALAATAPGDPAVQAHAAALEGRFLLAQGRGAEADARIQQAIFLESQQAAPLRLPDWYMLMAKAEPDRRREHVRAAYRALEAVRGLLPLRDPVTEESTYELHMRAVFEAAVDDALADVPVGSPSGEALAAPPDRSRVEAAQHIIETYREAELQNAFGSECLAEPPPVSAQALRPGEIILYPVVLPHRVELLYLSGDSGGVYRRLPPNAAYDQTSVTALVGALRRSIVKGSDAWRAPSQALYALLVKPIEAELRPGSTLIVIPDVTLSAAPFAALSDPQGRFLIEKTRLDIAPGLAYAQPGLERAGPRAFVVSGSLDEDVRLPFGAFEKLPNADGEARYAAGAGVAGGAHEGLYVPSFTRASLTRVLQSRPVDVLHLATHASFNGSSDKSFIVANGEFISLADLRGMIAANRERGHELDLLVLSACETAVGDDEASMGLAGAAVQAGARGAIASLWPVSDVSTATLIKGFYDRYRAGAGKAEAMQASQLAMLHDPRFQHPYFWASLILVGGWR